MANVTTRRTFLQTATFGSLGAAAFFNSYKCLAGSGYTVFDGIRNIIKEAVESGSPASLAIAAAKDGKIVWEEAFGRANRELNVPATTNTRYAIASLSKPFTALGVMVLIERGAVKLDDPIKKFLGNIKLTAYEGDAAAVTTRHLLQHTSGLPRHWRNFYSDESETPPTLEETFNRYGILVNQPGAEYLYTNLGYALLAHIIERVSGASFSEFMRKEVFLPLGLTDTTVENAARISRPSAALYKADGESVPFYRADESGSMSVASSIRDVIRFGLFHLKSNQPGQKQIIKPATIDQMARERYAVEPSSGSDTFYSLGWLGRPKSAYSYYNLSHSGDAPGVSALLVIFPNERIAVAALANTRFSEMIYTATDGVLDALLSDNKKMRESDPSMKPPTLPPFKPAEELLGEWAGEIKTYSGKIPALMTFRPDGDAHVKLEGQLETSVNQLQFKDGKLTGRFQGTITTVDAMRHPHQLRLVLRHKGDVLSGTVHAQSSIDAQAKNIPKRDYFALASWMKLAKKQ
jgi:CubicO group peptidase (beta-lactamase class C family)